MYTHYSEFRDKVYLRYFNKDGKDVCKVVDHTPSLFFRY